MALLLEHLKSINKDTKHTVYGFIREAQSLLPSNNIYYTIPNEICFLCICYYSKYHTFDTRFNTNLLGMDDKCRIIGRWKNMNDKHCSIFLNGIIKMNTGKYHWRFQVISCNADWQLIGVWRINGFNLPINTIFAYQKSSYALNISSAKLVSRDTQKYNYDDKFGVKCKNGDVIEMEFDSDELTVSYCINDKHHGIAFKVDHGYYRAGIGLFYAGDTIKIID